jgi:uncharacterized repeat protein (TIGR01451 family)/fimbrial isopeptide formation D2 family protein
MGVKRAAFLLVTVLTVLGQGAIRALGAPIPTASLNVPATGFIGEPFSFSVSFDNTSPTDPGYGPYVDLELPTIGIDGAGLAVDDGITFVNATYLGVPVNSTVLTCPVAAHPYTGAAIACTAGNQLVVLELPFGSFTNDQPPAVITVNANLSNLADLGAPLPIRATGVFRYGADPLDNPGSDPPITGLTHTVNFTPTLLTLTKEYIGPEDETATGPNFPRRYTLTVDIANGQTVTNLDVTDFLPNNLAFLSVISTSPGGASILQLPTIGAPANPPNNDLVVRFPSVTGSTGSSDATVTFEYYVPEFDANGVRIINANTGDDVISQNNGRAEADWTPIDTRDPAAHPVVDQAGPEHVLTDKSVAIQKGVSIINDVAPPGPSPGDLLEYTLNFQISDYFSFRNLRIQNDVLSDGQRVDGSFTPTLSVTENGATSSGTFAPSNFSVTVDSPGTGTSILFFDISGERILRGLDGRLLGGLVPDGGSANDGATTGVITYRAIILDMYTDDYPTGDPSLNNGDHIDNAVIIDGDVLNNSTLAPTGFNEADDSGAGLTIVGGEVFKYVYARNGVIGPVTQFAPGDTITYRIVFNIPTGDIEDLLFEDYLPLPVLYATEMTTFIDTVSAAAPPAGSAKFGPTDTFRAMSGLVPTISVDAVANMVRFTFGTHQNPANNSAVVDFLFTVTVSNDPFADGLYLTNQIRQSDHDTFNDAQLNDAIVQFQLTEPVINFTNIKGAVASTNPSAVYSPATVGPVTFSAPGSGCPRFTGTVHSNGLASSPVRSNVSNVDGGDRVTFAVIVENTGTSLLGAFDVRLRDTIPAGFSIPAGGVNLCVTDGTGAAMPFTTIGGGFFDPAGGIELTDPGPTASPPGALDPYHATSGRNVAVITYDLELDGPIDPAPVNPRQVLVNTATLFNYAGTESGPDHTVSDRTDSASATIAAPSLIKAIQSIVPNGTGGSSVTSGDIVTYAITVTLPEGMTPGLTLADRLPTGFQYVAGSVVVTPGTFNGTINTAPTISVSGTPVSGQTVNLSFGNTPVVDDNIASNNTFLVTLQAQVLNSAQNNGLPSPQTKTNRVDLDFTGNPGGVITSQVSTTYREPRLAVTKAMSPGNPDAGDLVTITVTVTNTGNSPAYDVIVSDNLPVTFFDETPGTSVNEGSTPMGFVYSYSAPVVTYTGGPIPAGASRVFTFTARVRADVVTGSSYQNTATASGDSQSGVVAQERTISNLGNATVGVPSSGVSKSIFSTSENSTDPGDANISTNPPVAIGEIITFRLTFTMPEGVTSTVTLADVLPSGLTLIPGTVTLQRSSTALVAANNPGGINAAAAGTPVPVVLSGTTGEVSLAMGSVSNNDNNNLTAETYVLSLSVVVDNTVSNNAGVTLTNVGRLRFLNFAGATQQVDTEGRSVHIAEPQVDIDKTADPTTASGGGVITFTLVISNPASGANAASGFDWVITDPLPARYLSPSISSIDAGGSGATVMASFSGNTLNASIDQLDPGESVTIVYTATVDPLTPFGSVIPNTATVTATSLPGPNGTGAVTPGAPGSASGERTGTGGVNDHNDSDPASVTLDIPTLNKATVSPQSYYAVGATATFRLTMGAPVGTSASFVVTDTMAGGLQFAPGSLTVDLPPGSTATNSPLEDTNPSFFTQSGNTLTFNFGSLTVPGAGNVVITYDVIVRNILSNQDGVILSNSATLSFTDPVTMGTRTIGPVSTPDPVRVGEPNLTMWKFVTAGAVGSDAGDTIRWRVTLQNSGHTTAYRLNWRDVLPNGLNMIDNVVVTPLGGDVFLNGTTTALTSAHAVIGTTTNANDTISLPLLQMAPGSILHIEFGSTVMSSATPGQVLNNQTRAHYTSLVGGGRDNSTNPGNVDDDNNADLNNYEESASQSVTLASLVAIDKSVIPSVYTIGQTVTYRIRVDMIQGTLPSLVVTDILPAGLSYVGHSISFGHIGMLPTNGSYNTRLGTGQTVQFNFGNLINPANGTITDDYILIQVNARVDNVAANQSGVVLRNGEQAEGSTLTLQYGSGPPTVLSFDHDSIQPGLQGVPITLIEPDLIVSKTANPTQSSLGDPVTFTITVQHSGQSTADAYDLTLVDVLPSGLTYVPGSVTLPASDVTISGQTLTFRISALTLLSGARSFSYRATVDPGAVLGETLTNVVDLTWASLPGSTGASSSGRNGIGGINDYATADTASVTPSAEAFIDAIKTVQDLNGGRVMPGDTLLYTILLINGDTPITDVIFTDTVPTFTTYVPGTLSASLGTPSSSGGVLSVAIPALAANQTVTISFRVTVNPGTARNTIISNQGVVDSAQTTPEPTDWDGDDDNGDQPTDVIVDVPNVPSLRATKTAALFSDIVAPLGTINTGDQVRYTITLLNTGPVPVTGVGFNDLVPAGPPGLTVTAVTTTQGTAPAPSNNVSIPDIGDIEPGDAVVITITGTVQGAGVICNQGTVNSTTIPSLATDANTSASDGAQQTCIESVPPGVSGDPALDITKGYRLVADMDKNGAINPGEVVRYSLVVSNTGSAVATNVVVTDPLPDEVSIVRNSVRPSQGAVVSEDPLIVNLGMLAAGAAATIQLDAMVEADAAGTTVENVASVQDDDGNFASASAAFSAQSISLDLAISKNHAVSFWVGQNALYVIEVRNVGQIATVGDITVTDNLPNGLSYVSAGGLGWTCDALGQAVTCTHPGPFNAGITSTIHLQVAVALDAPPTLTNTAQVSTPGDGRASNNFASDPTTIRGVAATATRTRTETPTRTPTRTRTTAGGSSTPTPTAGGVGTATRTATAGPSLTPSRTGSATRTPTPTRTPAAAKSPTRVPTHTSYCAGVRKLRFQWSAKTPAQATVFLSGTQCSPPPACFIGGYSGTVTLPPVTMTVHDQFGQVISTLLDAIPNSQGACPGGVDSYCHNGSTTFHIDRLRFVYGKNGVTTIRGKLTFSLDPPLLPEFQAPVSVTVTDSNGYELDLTFTRCTRRNTAKAISIQCY